jgi:hypothetical protein
VSFGKLEFSPTIQLGHIVQSLVILATLAGWAGIGYMTIQQQLAGHEADAKLLKQRVEQNEIALKGLRDEEKQLMIDTRIALERISGQIADLRAGIAGISPRGEK